MKSTLLSYLMSMFDNNAVGAMASQLGENQNGVSSALKSLVPTVLGGILTKANSSSNGAQQIMDMALAANNDSPWSNLAGALTGGLSGKGESLLGDLFGGGNIISTIANQVSGTSGLKTSSSSSLLKWIAPLVLSGLGKFISSKGLNLSSLTSLFSSERADIMSAMPSGLHLFGDAKASVDNVRSATSATTARATEYVEEKKKSNILLPLILLALLAGILWWAMKSCNKTDDGAAAVDTAMVTNNEVVVNDTTATTTTTTTTTTERTLGEVVLVNGSKLQAYAGGIEDQIVQFIGTDEYKNATEEQLKSKWFNFDDLNFEFGTTKLTAASQRQLDNIVAILKAYPDVKMKIGAYTDKKGDDAANMKLSQSRADAVKAALDKAGVGKQITGAEGYGEKFATVDENADDKAREADRKTAIRLAK